MFSLIPVLALLATANAVAIDRTGVQVEKRACLDPLGIFCNNPVATTTAKTTVATTTTKAVVPTTTAAVPTTTAIVPTTTVKATNGTTTATTGNIVNTIIAAPVNVVSQVLTCPLDPLGNLGLCGNAGTTTAAATTAVATTKVTTAAGTATTVASNPINTVASVVNSVITCPFGVVGLDGLCPTAPATTVAATTKATTAAGTATTAASNPINTVASVVNSIITCPFGVVGLDGLCPTAPATTVVATTTAKATTPASSSTTAAASSSSSSASSIIASVSSSSAASSSSAVTSTSSATPSASATPVNPTVSGWAYQAVVAEGTGGRALTGSTYAGSSMTVESCLAFCDNAGFPLAGLEYSSECYCGSSLSNGASLTKTATGGMACSGNPNELCGGSSALSLYRSTKSNGAGLNSDLTSQAVALPAGWSSTTCMQEVSGRAFTKKSLVANDMTIQKCLSFCGDSKYAGLEYGTECYCADVLSNGASLSSTSGQCNTACGGSSSTTCGGPNALQVYTNANKQTSAGAYSNTGCVQEVSGRLLRGASIAADNMSIETCTSFCQSQGFSIAGLEYGRECYCDNSYFSAPLQSGQCNMNCAGNANENCGGPNALNIFTLGA